MRIIVYNPQQQETSSYYFHFEENKKSRSKGTVPESSRWKWQSHNPATDLTYSKHKLVLMRITLLLINTTPLPEVPAMLSPATRPVSSNPMSARPSIPVLLSAYSQPHERSRPLPSPRLSQHKVNIHPSRAPATRSPRGSADPSGRRACVHTSFCVIPHFPMARMSTCFSRENHSLRHFQLQHTWRSVTTQF